MKNLFSRWGRVLLLLALPFLAQAQTGGVGIGTTAPNASAALDVTSTTKGLLPPRMTQAQRDAIANPVAGLTVYNTSTNKLNTWNGTAWAETLTTTEQSRQSAAVTFTYTGSAQTYTVPAGVTSLNVVALGGQGGIGVNGTTNPNGGGGGRVSTTLAVTPGETLTITVGGQGAAGIFGTSAGGFNGGGTGYNGAGGGGGATDLRRSGTALTNRILVAAGGGGAASPSSSNSDGGAGGGLTGATGGDGGYGPNAPGTGATQTAGGSAGGSLGIGGNAAAAGPGACGGGGGGGYYGGGGARQAASAGGGGGSSFVQVAGSTGTVHTAGSGTGNGSLTITIPEYAAPALDGTNFVNVPGTWQVNGGDVYRNTGSVGIGTATPASSAALDVSSISKGLLPPRLSTAQRNAIASPAAGLTVYNTSTGKLNVWNGTAWDASLSATEQPSSASAVTFTYTGAAQTYTVPAGVTSLNVVALGGQGGIGASGINTYPNGGGGGRVNATLAVTPGEILTITVGGQGAAGTSGTSAGGFNGGGTGYNSGGGGGGATDLRRGGAALTNRILVAAGGGGAGISSFGSEGGTGGGLTGATGGNGGYGSNAPGTGATQTAGGSVGGGLGAGGNAATVGTASACGGGGGGGYYGGGGAQLAVPAGGGGGSSFVQVAGSTGTVYTAGSGTGNGSFTITITGYAAPAFDGTNFVNVPGTWTESGPNVYRGSGNVGIGTSVPTQKLDVTGNTTVTGNSYVGGNVGIGTSSPRGQLDVAGTGDVYLTPNPANSGSQSLFLPGHIFLAPFNGTSGMSYIQARTGTAGANLGIVLRATNAGTLLDALVLNPNGTATFSGNVGIGTTPSTTYTLDVNGPGHFSASVTANGFTNTSDARFKQNVRPLAGALAGVLALRGVRYTWNALGVQHGGTAGAEQVGLIAQELEKLYPELVVTDAAGYKSVNYSQLTPVLIEAIKELKAENAALRQQGTAQAIRLDQQQASLSTLQEQMARLLGKGTQARK